MNYLVAPGAQLAVGTQGTTIACRFEEGGSSAMAEMMMQVPRAQQPTCLGRRRCRPLADA